GGVALEDAARHRLRGGVGAVGDRLLRLLLLLRGGARVLAAAAAAGERERRRAGRAQSGRTERAAPRLPRTVRSEAAPVHPFPLPRRGPCPPRPAVRAAPSGTAARR